MEKNIVKFDMELKLKGGKKAVDWVREYLGQFDGVVLDEDDPGWEAQYDLAEKWGIYVEGEGFQLGFDWKIKGVTTRSPSLWIGSGDSGNNAQAASLIQMYLKKFDPDGYDFFTWSSYAPGSIGLIHGGGAVFITAKKVDGVSGLGWAMDKERAFKARKKAKKKPARKKRR